MSTDNFLICLTFNNLISHNNYNRQLLEKFQHTTPYKNSTFKSMKKLQLIIPCTNFN